MIPIVELKPLGCDGCTMCCKLKAVDELAKPVGVWCPHCNPGKGCEINGQPERPQACADWECVWLQSQRRPHGSQPMSPALRPDRCKVVMDLTTDGKSLVLHVDPSRPDAWRDEPVRSLVKRALAKSPVYVACGSSRKMIAR